ncbi:aspartate kinase [Dentipellis sp. KUC8613]|nr:aspartate kinase [Dentipellis sp. KUC8613]
MSTSSTPSASPPLSCTSLSRSPSPSPPRTPPNLHQNTADPAAQWLVQKYGGTSVGKFADRIAGEIVPCVLSLFSILYLFLYLYLLSPSPSQPAYLDQHKLAIVCSARSGSTKALGTTNLLLRAASEALQRPPPSVPATTPSVPPTPGTSTPLAHFLRDRSSSQHSPSRSNSHSHSHSHSAMHSGSSSLAGSLTLPPLADDAPAFSRTVDILRAEHLAAARRAVRAPDVLGALEAELVRDCEDLRGFLHATQVIDEISPRSRDSIVGFGERLACKIVAAALRDRGVDAEFVSLDGVVPEYEEAEGALGQAFYDRVAEAFAERIKLCGPRVPVVTGFFGPVPGSLLRQIGRGYTDLAAALLAAGLHASELQIWKEVDGIFTADPRKVPTARLIPLISPEEAAELTYYGSEVVHPFTMEQVIRRKIPIRIKNVENPTGGGTVIHPDGDAEGEGEGGEGVGVPDFGTLALEGEGLVQTQAQARRLPTAVTIKERIVVLNVNSNRKSVSHGFLAGIFGTLDRWGVVVDLISTSEVHVSMAIENVLDRKVLARLVRELEKSGTVSVHHDMAILSLVGKQMRNMVGIAGRMFATLAQGNVNIEMISQGANEINISCVIELRDAVKALNLIHQSCLQIKPEGPKGRVGPWLF